MKTTDAIIVIVIFLITAVLIISLIMHFLPKGNVPTPLANPSEVARFIRYMSCSLAACVGGCDSSETYAVTLEYGQGDKPTLGCNQLLHDENYCTGANVGEKLCGSTKALDFTFKKKTRYTGNYDVTWDNPGPCSLTQDGWQTDASCLGGWEDDFIDCACLTCMGVMGHTSVRPEGQLFKKSGGCGRDGSFSHNSGAIWIPESMVTDGTCIVDTEKSNPFLDVLAWCDFTEGQEIKFWAEKSSFTRKNCWWLEFPILGGCYGLSLEGIPYHSCHQIVICDT